MICRQAQTFARKRTAHFLPSCSATCTIKKNTFAVLHLSMYERYLEETFFTSWSNLLSNCFTATYTIFGPFKKVELQRKFR
jgi:hypothetical protein